MPDDQPRFTLATVAQLTAPIDATDASRPRTTSLCTFSSLAAAMLKQDPSLSITEQALRKRVRRGSPALTDDEADALRRAFRHIGLVLADDHDAGDTTTD